MNIIQDIRPATLTLQMLEAMEPETIFAHGYMEYLHPWFNNLKNPYSLSVITNALGGILRVAPRDSLTARAFIPLETPKSKYRLVKWVAHRGHIQDWSIYHSIDGNFCAHDYFDCDCHLAVAWEEIMRHGAKMHADAEIKRFVPCTDEAFSLYRH